MDMTFPRRSGPVPESSEPLRLDHGLLLAALAAQNGAQAPEVSDVEAPRQAVTESEEEPLIELLIGGPDWRRAASRLRGCFSRAEAGRRINGL